MVLAHYGRENGAWKPYTSLATVTALNLAHNLPAEYPSSAPEVMAHYFPQFPKRLAPTPVPDSAATPGYYYNLYYKPGTVENGTDHRRYGGFTRDYPIQTNLSSTGVAGWEQRDMEEEVRDAIEAGLTGFTVDLLTIRGYDGTTPDANWTRTKRLFDAVDNVNNTDGTNFKLMPMPDGTAGYATALIRNGTVPDINASADALANAISQLAAHPCVYRLNGKLMVGPYGPEKWPLDATGVTAADRLTFWTRLKTTLANTYSEPTNLWMCYVDQWTGSTCAPLFNPIAYGHGRWGDRDALTVAANTTNNRGAPAYCHTTYGKPWMHFGGTPGDTRPVSAGTSSNTYRTWESWGTRTLTESWLAAIDGDADFNQIPTWSDYSEHAHIAPSRNNTRARLDLQAYFIARYRSGYWPEIVRDAIYITHRIQRSDTPISSATLQTAFSTVAGGTPIKNDFEVLVFATAPAVVEILHNDAVISTQNIDIPGLTRLTAPLPSTAGFLAAQMVRAGEIVPRTVVTAEQPLTITPTVDDYHPRTVSSLRSNEGTLVPNAFVTQAGTGTGNTVPLSVQWESATQPVSLVTTLPDGTAITTPRDAIAGSSATPRWGGVINATFTTDGQYSIKVRGVNSAGSGSTITKSVAIDIPGTPTAPPVSGVTGSFDTTTRLATVNWTSPTTGTVTVAREDNLGNAGSTVRNAVDGTYTFATAIDPAATSVTLTVTNTTGSDGDVVLDTTPPSTGAGTFTGTNGSAPNSSEVTVAATTGSTATIQSNALRLLTGTTGSYNDRVAITATPALDGNQTLTVDVTPASITNEMYLQLSVRDTATGLNLGQSTGYRVEINSSGYAYISRPSDGTTIGTGVTLAGWAAGTTQHIEYSVIGTTIAFRAWTTGTRPTTPTITGTDTSISAGTHAGITLQSGATGSPARQVTIDNLTITSSPYTPPVTVTVGRDPSTPTSFGYTATGATNTTVRSTLNPAGTGATNTTDLANINNAITSANTAGGGIVQLNAGTYWINGRILMRSNVTLRGVRTAGQDATVIIKAGTNFVTNPKWSGYSMLTVNDWGYSNMTVKDITFDQSGDTLNGNVTGRLSAYAVEFREATNVVFDGVTVKQAFTYHLVMVNCATFGVRNCGIYNNIVGKYDQLDGIHILQSNNGDVVDNRVENGAGGTTGDADDGLVMHTIDQVCHHVNYRNNWVRAGRHGQGIQLAGGSQNIYNANITGNTFVGTSTPRGVRFGYYGSATSSVNLITITGNRFEDCTQYCVDLDDGPNTNCTVTGNTALRSGGYNVSPGNGNVVSGNTTVTS